VRVHHEIPHARREKVVKGKSDERLVKHRHQRLGERVGERTQPCSQPRSEDERRFHSDLAQPLASSARRRIESAAQAAPNPLSMFTTDTRLAQLVSIASNAEIPPRFAP